MAKRKEHRGVIHMMNFFQKTNFDFVSKRHFFFGLSAALILVTVVSIISHKGLNYGIDFTGGTLVQLKFAQKMPLPTPLI